MTLTLELLEQQLQKSLQDVERNRADALRAEGMVLLLQHQIQQLRVETDTVVKTE